MQGTRAERLGRYAARWRQGFDERLVLERTQRNISLPAVRTRARTPRQGAWGNPVCIAKFYPRLNRLFSIDPVNLEER